MPGRRRRDRRRPELSQHFLRSPALAAELVEQSSIGSSDLVVEIGPGRGMLTEALARRCRELRAVELDASLARGLRRRFEHDPQVSIVRADFLRYRLPRGEAWKAFGNIPFNRTTEIVERIAGAASPPDDAFLVVQLEAAARFAGTPFAPESVASLRLRPWWQMEIVRRLRRSDYHPPPRVDTALLWMARRARPLVTDGEAEAWRAFIERSFGRSGNTVGRCLRGTFTRRQLLRLGRDLGFDPGAPPSALWFDQWLALFRFRRLKARD